MNTKIDIEHQLGFSNIEKIIPKQDYENMLMIWSLSLKIYEG